MRRADLAQPAGGDLIVTCTVAETNWQRDGDEATRAERLNAVCEQARIDSLTICEQCGAPGELRRPHHAQVLCWDDYAVAAMHEGR